MKKLVSVLRLFIFGIFELIFIPIVCSQTTYHPFLVKRLNFWAPDYLTVTCNFLYVIDNYPSIEHKKDMLNAMRLGMEVFRDFKEEDYIWIDKEKSGEIPLIGSSIIEINGKSTKGMSENEFYTELAKNNTHNLKFLQYKFVKNTKTITSTIVLKDTPSWLKELSLDKFYQDFAKNKRQIIFDNEKERNERTFNSMRLLWDQDFDWSQVRTYDFVITGNDPLTDKELLKGVEEVLDGTNYLRRDRNNPQILITIAKEAKQSIQTSYVPPVVQTVQTGSQTRTVYNWFTKRNDYVTQNQYQVYKENGYTTSTQITDEFIELCYLDAKRVKDSLQKTPPIIYQQVAERHITTKDRFNIMDDYKAALSWATHPIIELSKVYAISQNVTNCISFDMDNNNYIIRVSQGGDASRAGLRIGDKVIKIRYNKPEGMCTLNIQRGKKKLKIILPKFGQYPSPRFHFFFIDSQ